jgi:hypothetical protein
MKHTVLATLALAASLSVSAAPTYTDSPSFTDNSGNPISLQQVRSLQATSGSFTLTFNPASANGPFRGGQTTVSDPTGAILTKVLAMPYFTERYVEIVNHPGSATYVDIFQAGHTTCNGGVTTIQWPDTTVSTAFTDTGCVVFAAIQALGY